MLYKSQLAVKTYTVSRIVYNLFYNACITTQVSIVYNTYFERSLCVSFFIVLIA